MKRTIRTREDARRYVDGLLIRANALELPSVRRWRLAAKATMLTLLAFSGLQYYFLNIFLEIISLPGITVFTGPITIGVG
jgi:hypothetical protein